MKQINWGIIGVGDVAELKSGPAFQKAEGSNLLAVMRRNAEKAKDFADRHQVPHWYDDAEKLIANPEINAIYVATPPSSHEGYAIQALRAGKDVYLEKPMAPSLAACDRIIEEVEKSGKKLSVAHYRRALPAFMKVKALLDAGAIGDVRFAQIQIFQPAKSKIIAQTESNWRVQPDISGGGLFHDIAPHQMDLMYHYFGKPLGISGYSTNQAGMYPADDIVSAEIRFPKGVIFKGLWSFACPESAEREGCEIVGSKGSITFSFYGEKIHLNTDKKETFTFENPENIQLPMIKKVNHFFRGEGKNPCAAEEGRLVMKMLNTATSKKQS
ncbi:1,5-anhydro-D-fructose reductase (1,5-anhydro-D-mannitol-forming) [Catalinimonas alkaloidigena]|uniref:Gfo/Idh/MocA family protein n=1 Tax=Catalinimonas alkaloidigena TaxID=1075417 RepID=UPI00240500AC|nr:Gfo/Idh/MocA family oxidoreductase [Catalinimonas alkaloidigena]MDF9796669.1 1,5-anhydro-D-fructose reductase (1,5-anhydro-D-mannitol-forming) [Catalinimonas alkaloidigena]